MDDFKTRLRARLKWCARTYDDMARVLGLNSKNAFKYKVDNDSFTRVELLRMKADLGLDDQEFLVLLGVNEGVSNETE